MGAGVDEGVGVGVVVSVWVFGTFSSFQVRWEIIFLSYALAASFLKQGNHADLGMH